MSKYLSAFLVARQILCGTGIIRQLNNGEFQYHISQRAPYINMELGNRQLNRSDRAIINTRDEPHAQKNYLRLHLTLGDANMSQTSTLLKVGTTGLMLRMIEEKFIKNMPQLASPAYAIKQISCDPTLRAKVSLTTNQKVTALDILEICLEHALRFAETNLLIDEEQFILNIWADIVSKLRRDPMECYQELDWIIKLFWTQWYQDQTGLPLEHVDVRSFAYQYHNIDPENSIYFDLLRQGKIVRHISDEPIQYAKNYAPHNTRAKIRGELINAMLSHPEYKNSFRINWGEIMYASAINSIHNDPLYPCIELSPFETEHEKINWLIEQIEKDSGFIRKNILAPPPQLDLF